VAEVKTFERFAIVTPTGGVWSRETYDTKEDAWAAVKDYFPDAYARGYRVQAARVQIEILGRRV
jgi:hypothetical protein